MKVAFNLMRRYADADDPRVAAANLVALVLAWNTPFYPLYLLGAAGPEMQGTAWLTLFALPIFLVVPAVTRWNGIWGRVFLVVAGTINSLYCTWLLGEASGTALFLLPCIILTALVFRRNEAGALFTLLALPIVAGIAMNGRYPISPYICIGASCSAIVWLNVVSVAILLAFLGVLFTGLADGGHQITKKSSSAQP